jgi:LysM repeat protein
MKKLWLPILLCVCTAGSSLFAQSSAVIREYIDTYKDLAIEEMKRSGVPASITLAQGIHETGAGQSNLVRKSNNHFGIKCKTGWTGQSVSHDDDARGECFRKYDDPADSYRDHSDFLKNRAHYAFLFELDPTDYEAWAYGLKKAGYATNPKYPLILIKLIRDYNLQDYTLIALGKLKGEDKWAKVEDVEAPVETFTAAKYPSGVFKINETNVVVVTKGTPFLVVAEKHEVSLRRLFDFNDMEPREVADRDQLIYLRRKRKTGANEFHKVAPGETLYDIAQAEGIRLESLLNLNMLSAGAQPEVGEVIYLKSHAPTSPRLASARQSVAYAPTQAISESSNFALNSSENYILHTVQAKETAYAISKKYEVSVAELLEWNGMQSTALKTGQQLRIYKKRGNATN